MGGQVSNEESVHVSTQDHEPEAFEQQVEGSLTQSEFGARVAAKREQAAQDAGYVEPPQADAPLTPEAKEALGIVDEPVAEEEPVQPPEPIEGEEEPLEPTELEEGEEPEDELDDADFYAGRYRDRDAVEQALREKDSTIDRLFKEVDERRQEVENALQAREGEPQQLDVEAWGQWAEDAVANGAGAEGAMRALQTGGRAGYNIYLGHWLNDDESRPQALAFNNEVMLSFAEQRAVQQAESLRTLDTDRSPTEEAKLAQSRVAERYPDFNQHTDSMDRLVNEEGLLPDSTKEWLAGMAREGVEGKERAWDYLYLAAQALNAPNRRRAAAEEKKQRRASGDAAKTSAMVSSSEGTPARTPLTEAELIHIRKKNELRERTGLPLLDEE